MAKRATKAEVQGLIWLVIIGLPLYGLYKFAEAVGWVWIGVGVVVAIALYVWFGYRKRKAKEVQEKVREAELLRREAERVREEEMRRSNLLKKYGDAKVVEAIMRESYWQGQTAEQLRDALGLPADVDQKVLKTKTKEIWKYRPIGANRYGLRITLEQGQVVGWDEKL